MERNDNDATNLSKGDEQESQFSGFCLVSCYFQLLIMNFAAAILEVLFMTSIEPPYTSESIPMSVLPPGRHQTHPSGVWTRWWCF